MSNYFARQEESILLSILQGRVKAIPQACTVRLVTDTYSTYGAGHQHMALAHMTPVEERILHVQSSSHRLLRPVGLRYF